MPAVRALTLGLALCAAAMSSNARAGNAEAEAAFARGEKLLAEGKVAEACQAYAASATPELSLPC